MKHPLDYRANQVGGEPSATFVKRADEMSECPFLLMRMKLHAYPRVYRDLVKNLFAFDGQLLDVRADDHGAMARVLVPAFLGEAFRAEMCPIAVKVLGERKGPMPYWGEEELAEARGAVARAAIAAAAKKERRSREKSAERGVKVRHLSVAKAPEATS